MNRKSLDDLENQVILYRNLIKIENSNLNKDELRLLLRKKVNRKFKEKNKQILGEMIKSYLNLISRRDKDVLFYDYKK